VEFCRSYDLEPSWMMKKADTMPAYQAARLAAVKRSNGNGEAKLPVPPRHRSVEKRRTPRRKNNKPKVPSPQTDHP
jgi:hypothetical protein